MTKTFTLVHVSGGVLPLSSRCSLLRMQHYSRGRKPICLTFTYPITPRLRHSHHARQQVSERASLQHFVAIGQGNPDRECTPMCLS
ncbi:hypothetical protein CY34DRAFT_811180 [Suillus luteus UH-Slu-Lm8-n1]|uniref:Uncharacterized protein n=1 Tax=Suillus luteus UH-Slu-Lm8-n1 TaxID=930992 RepID=A0A0D0AXK7_9AGAM|nr:hypothetical protein CY34DRAFT_811180 [Suillus luteus UH-Slu-Lm8-n1]